MFRKLNLRVLLRQYSQSAQGYTKGPSGSTPPQPKSSTGIDANVPGLSNKIIKPATGPVGPGASATGEYKVPEYYCYNRMSYHEAEIELLKYRCPQPSAVSQ